MDLITKLSDERLATWLHRDEQEALLFDSLRTALEERDDERKAKYCEREFKEMFKAELAAALEDLKSNASMLAKQTDLAREVEIQRDAALSRAEEAERHAKRLDEYMLKGIAFRDELQARVKELECQKKALQQVNEGLERQLRKACEGLVSTCGHLIELEKTMHEINSQRSNVGGMMTREGALNLKSFKHYCICGGYAYEMNGRNPEDPHTYWCPQREEWMEWKDALKGKLK